MNTINIRKFKKSDFYEIIKNGYTFSPYYLIPKPSLSTRIFKIINKVLGIKDEKFTIVMEKNDKILGTLTYFNFDKDIWITGPLFVAPDARRLGVGKKLVSYANNILREKGIHKAYGDVPLENPAKYLHTKLGCQFFDFTFVIEIKKDLTFIKNPISEDGNYFRKLSKEIELFEKIEKVLSKNFIDFFNFSKINYYYPFNSDLRKISRIFFKKVKYLVHNDTVVLLNEMRIKPISDISIYLNSIDDIDYISQKILNYLKIEKIRGRLFFKQSLNLKEIQSRLKKRKVSCHIDEIMVYFL